MRDTRAELHHDVATRERARLTALAARVVDWDEAEDVVQEALIRLERDPVRLRPPSEVTAWLRRVSLNLAFNRRRDLARWRDRSRRAGVQEAVETPETLSLRWAEREAVRAVLEALSERHRNILLLRYSGHSYTEIATALEMPVSSVGTTLARAEAAFRATYEEEST